MSFTLRAATLADRPELTLLIDRSARQLCAADYDPAQIEAALQGAFGVDTQLIEDGTYFVAEDGGTIVGCGGWSKRATAFGGDQHTARDATLLDPRTQAAKIRAFFVAPSHARRGIGKAILARCESAARAQGFTQVELVATLTGVALYAAQGYTGDAPIEVTLPGDVRIDFVPMRKRLDREPAHPSSPARPARP